MESRAGQGDMSVWIGQSGGHEAQKGDRFCRVLVYDTRFGEGRRGRGERLIKVAVKQNRSIREPDGQEGEVRGEGEARDLGRDGKTEKKKTGHSRDGVYRWAVSLQTGAGQGRRCACLAWRDPRL